MPTRTQAKDEMYKILEDWVGSRSELVPLRGKLIFADRAEQPVRESPPSPWARVSIRHNQASQRSLSDELGKTRWTKFGILFIEIRTPFGDGETSADVFADIIEQAYEGVHTTLGVWFRNVHSEEIGRDGVWQQTNVIVEFEYDQVR